MRRLLSRFGFLIGSCLCLICVYYYSLDVKTIEVKYQKDSETTDICSVDKVSTHGTCSFQERRCFLRKRCIQASKNATKKNPKQTDRLFMVIFDYSRKVLGCPVSKAASTSWSLFLAKNAATGPTDKVPHILYGHKNNTAFGLYNMSSVFGVPVEDINGKYADWKKYIVVRHPLQRLVSAYFETVKRRKKYGNVSIPLFMQKIGNNTIEENNHWKQVYKWCKPCQVDFDYVIKLETIEEDQERFLDAIGAFRNRTALSVKHKSGYGTSDKSSTILNKYDKVFSDIRDNDPVSLERVLSVYKNDMDIFGYSYDTFSGSSGCRYSNGSCC